VLGGDGTVSEAADGLAGSPTVLAPLPAGVTNVFARALGGPPGAIAAAEGLAVRAARHRRHAAPLASNAVDLGTVNGRHFLFSSGVGLSAAIMAKAEAAPERKASLGQLHFTAAAVSVLARATCAIPRSCASRPGGAASTASRSWSRTPRCSPTSGPAASGSAWGRAADRLALAHPAALGARARRPRGLPGSCRTC
jgi:hypothetical protein